MTNADIRTAPFWVGAIALAGVPMAVAGWLDPLALIIMIVPLGVALALAMRVYCRFCHHHPLRHVTERLTKRGKKAKPLPHGGLGNDLFGDRCSRCGGYWKAQAFSMGEPGD